MHGFRKLLALTATLVVALAAFVVGATPAAAVAPDPPCEWASGQSGTSSGCDGLPFIYTMTDHCAGFVVYPYEAIIRGPGGVALARVAIGYYRGAKTAAFPSGDCRVAFAEIDMYSPYASCYVKVQRNSDGQAYYVGGEYSDLYTKAMYTAVVYDANVSSYAWGHCEYNSSPYSAGTSSY